MATREQQIKFINEAIHCAQAAYAIYGKVRPSIAVAMACVECAYGTAGSVRHHSYLGHKVGSGKTATKEWGGKFFTASTKEEYTVGTHTVIKAAFRAYDSMQQCFMNFYELLNTKLYDKVLPGADYRAQMQQIKDCGYMTSSTEVNAVISIIDKFGLTKYDAVGVPADVKPLYEIGLYEVGTYALNIRDGNSAKAIDVGDLRKGSVICVDDIKGGWGHFEGWCNLKYCKSVK